MAASFDWNNSYITASPICEPQKANFMLFLFQSLNKYDAATIETYALISIVVLCEAIPLFYFWLIALLEPCNI
jgi:hypothetical protein